VVVVVLVVVVLVLVVERVITDVSHVGVLMIIIRMAINSYHYQPPPG